VPADPTAPYTPAVPGTTTINTYSGQTQVEVDNYTYDSNVIVLQGTMETARQITTDVLVHKAIQRYLKSDITVMYSPNATFSVTNAAIGTALSAFLTNQYFGSVIRLGDILDVVHQVPGVVNVRWSNDLPSTPNLIRVIETDVNGYPLHTPTVDRNFAGTSSSKETQRLYVPGRLGDFGVADSFTLTWTDTVLSTTFTTAAITLSTLTAGTVQTAIQAAAPGSGLYNGITVSADVYAPPLQPIQTFKIQYNVNGTPFLPIVTPTVTQSTYTHDADFYLHDSELPSLPIGTTPNDTVPGVIIRPRAQNTFVRPGIG
jgi:hypothetical protein